VLSLSGVSASYGAVPAVSDISIEVGEGEPRVLRVNDTAHLDALDP